MTPEQEQQRLIKAVQIVFEGLREQKPPVILVIDGNGSPFRIFGFYSFEEFEKRAVEEHTPAECITVVKNAMKIRPAGCTVSLTFGINGHMLVALHGGEKHDS